MALSGRDLADLYPLLGIVTPPTPPYTLDGRFTRERPKRIWHYDDFTGIVGDSDLAGDASVDTGGARPYLRADLVSKRLDFDDLAGFVGAAPQAGRGETSNAELQRSRPRRRPRARACCPTRPTNWTSCARWMPTCAARRIASTRRDCRWTTWTRTCCWKTACCGWSR